MLTADLVDARRKDGELLLRPLDDASRREAAAIGAAYLDAAKASIGRRREELEEEWDSLADETAKHFKLAAGLKKLVADACTFEAEAGLDPVEIRRALFLRASDTRRALADGAPFDRSAVLEKTAQEFATTTEGVEAALFADLRSEHVLREAPALDAPHLVEAWELGQAQAVLLAAIRVTCDISSGSPGLVRAFFAKLKFHQLLFSATRLPGGEGWRVTIDGPYSMFDAVTKYGLRLALVLPALRALEQWKLVAEIRWGKAKEALIFRLSSDGDVVRDDRADGAHVSDEVRELAEAINALDVPWKARVASEILEVPGQGVCIPDLELTHKKKKVFVEVLGYWSRDAVFRRVELAEKGLDAPVVFAVSSRLRVSSEVLDEKLGAAIYVYKGKMSPRAIVEHADRVTSRSAGASSSRTRRP